MSPLVTQIVGAVALAALLSVVGGFMLIWFVRHCDSPRND